MSEKQTSKRSRGVPGLLALLLLVLSMAAGRITTEEPTSVPSVKASSSAAATLIYWGEIRLGTIMRGNADGSGTPQQVVGGQSNPRGLAINTTTDRLYWIERDAGRIRSANLDGSGISTVISGLSNPDRLAVDPQAGYLYWTENAGTNRIRRANLNGSGVTTLLSGLAAPVGIALDTSNNYIYWTEFDGDSVWRATLEGNNKQKLVQQPSDTRPLDIVLDVARNRMYWASGVTGNIYSAALNGNNDTVWNSFEETRALAIDSDGGKLYWGSHSTTRVRRGNLNGSGIETLFAAGDGVDRPSGLVTYAPSGPTCFNLSLSSSPSAGGNISASPSSNCSGGRYTSGTVVTLTANSATGYLFDGWSGNLGGSANPETVTMNSDKSVTANFAASEVCYSLVLGVSPAAGGGISASPQPNCAGGEYAEDTLVTLTANPASGYRFSNWSGALTGTGNPKSLTMDGDKSVTANFTADEPCFTLSVTVSPPNGGDVSVTPPNCAGGKYVEDTVVTLTATSTGSFYFSSWSGAVTGPANPTTLLMNGNKTVTASFAEISATCHPLTRLRSGEGSFPVASPSGSSGCAVGAFKSGQTISLTAAPAAGWRVSGWNGTSNDGSSAIVNSVIMPDSPHTVTVQYTRLPQTTSVLYLPIGLDQPQFCFPTGNEYEPNNFPAQANGPLCSSGTYAGLPNDTLDYFELQTSQTGRIAVTVLNHRGEGVQLSLYFDNIDGPPVARDGDLDEMLFVEVANAAPGRYYIVIFAETPKPQVTMPYSMDVVFP